MLSLWISNQAKRRDYIIQYRSLTMLCIYDIEICKVTNVGMSNLNHLIYSKWYIALLSHRFSDSTTFSLFQFLSFFIGIFWFCIKIGVNKKTLYGCPQCTQRNRRQNSITCEIDSSRKVIWSFYGNSLVPEFRDLGSMWFFAVNVSFTSTFTFWSLSIVEWHFFAIFSHSK